MMAPDEQYLINVLTAIGGGHVVGGRFHLGVHYAQLMLDLYAAPPLHVEFRSSKEFSENLERFRSRRKKCLRFCTTLWHALNSAAEEEIGLAVGKQGALGLFALFDIDIREHAEDHV